MPVDTGSYGIPPLQRSTAIPGNPLPSSRSGQQTAEAAGIPARTAVSQGACPASAGRREPRPVSNLSRLPTFEPGTHPTPHNACLRLPPSRPRLRLRSRHRLRGEQTYNAGPLLSIPAERTRQPSVFGVLGRTLNTEGPLDTQSDAADGRRPPPAREGGVYVADTPMSIDRPSRWRPHSSSVARGACCYRVGSEGRIAHLKRQFLGAVSWRADAGAGRAVSRNGPDAGLA